MKKTQQIMIEATVDLDAYRREYGEPEATMDEALDYVWALVEQGAVQATRPFDYVTIRERHGVQS